PLADGLLLEALSERGEELLAGSSFAACKDGESRRLAAEAGRPIPFGRQLNATVEDLPEILRKGYSSKVYQRHGERCFSCGTCNLVCPTCYCFEVRDDMALDGASGRRSRTWDSCMVPGFAEVAGPHNFRPEVGERQRHRLKRKFEYLPERFAHGSFCVGCGRCGRQCTANIDIFDMVNDIVVETGGGA
ncbi:MAG: 4Fe-4S dicluster domain-containing protein, partial [Desulfobulbaceae bacterium]|nr:4Fe-4S dicluster domain-containing protein [Desulfobulbaceae bacterium]